MSKSLMASISRLWLATIFFSLAFSYSNSFSRLSQPLYGDSAYTGEQQEKEIKKVGMVTQVHEKGYKNRPLTKKQLKSNHKKSKFRTRVVRQLADGFMDISMKKMYIQSIGKVRAEGIIGLMNLTYNLLRSIQIRTLRGIRVSI